MSREFKIGVTVAAALAMVYFGSTYLAGSNPFKEQKEYYALYDDVNGLLVSNEVRYQGFKVGRVSNISFQPKQNQWLVSFSIDENSLEVMDQSVAMIGSADILGTMVIELQDIQKGLEFLHPGDTLQARVKDDIQKQVNDQIRPLVVKVEALIGNVDSVITVVTSILDKRTISNMQGSMEKIPSAIENLVYITQRADSVMKDIEDAQIGSAIANINSITNNLRKNNDALTGIFNNLENITDSLAQSNVKQTFNSLGGVLAKVDSIASEVQAGKGSLGLMLKDEKLYNDLAFAAADLDLLLMDLRAHPKRYFHFSLFGKKGKKKEPLERDVEEYQRNFPEFLIDTNALRTLIKEELENSRTK